MSWQTEKSIFATPIKERCDSSSIVLFPIVKHLANHFELIKICHCWEVVVAQLAERLLMILEDPGSNPVIGNFYLNIYLLLTVCRKDENKEKEAENGPYF